MIRQPPRLPDPSFPWFDPASGRPTDVLYKYMQGVDAALRALIKSENGDA